MPRADRPGPPQADAPAEAAADSLAYIVSHDLRAPLRAVEGFARIVKEDYGAVLDRVGHDHLERILGAAARMNAMIDSLLELSQLAAAPFDSRPVDLSQLAEEIVADLRAGDSGRVVCFEIEPGLAAHGDPALLRQMFENLLGNAWKYTIRKADARIAVRRHASDPLSITIEDNGAGFDMRHAGRLFTAFQRLHSASEFPGSGVGLASVRRIAERHGGAVWAEGEAELGARFHVRLAGFAPAAGPAV